MELDSKHRSGCLVAIFRLFRGAPSRDNASATALPYRRKDFLLTRAERLFFSVLHEAVGKHYWLFAKIRVADLVWMPKGTGSRQSYFNRIQGKHIDFLLCDRDAVRPILAIELDDSSHQGKNRRSRDQFVDEALRTAGLPLLRVACRASYDLNDIRAQIRSALHTKSVRSGVDTDA